MPKIAALITLLMIVLISAMLHIGASRRDDSIAAYLGNHVQKLSGIWCWQGICPKRTSFTQAKLQIEASGEKILQDQIANTMIDLRPDAYLNFYSMDSSETSPITVVDVIFRQNVMSVGDAYQLFGMPIVIWRGTKNLPVSQRGICFKGGVCAYFESTARLSPFTYVKGLSIYGSTSTRQASGYSAWTGFVSLPPS